MKPLLACCIVASLLSYGSLSLADEQHHETKTGGETSPAVTSSETPAKASSDSAPSTMSARPSSSALAMEQMDEHVKKMHALHERMISGATADERQKAMADARKEMQAGMIMMQPMMRADSMTNEMGSPGTAGPSGDSSSQMRAMRKRLDMMQMMMQIMMDQQEMTSTPMERRP